MSQPCSNCGLPTVSKYGVCARRGTGCRKVRDGVVKKNKYHANPEAGRAKSRAWNAAHPESSRASAKRQRLEGRALLRALKIGKSCVDCGLECTEGNFPAFQWDHRPGVTKTYNVSNMACRGEIAILAEIAKCDLRCANCHAIITHQRMRVT